MMARFTGFIYFALVFVLAVVLFAVTLSPTMWQVFTGNIDVFRTEAMMGSVLMMLLSILFLQTSLITRRAKDYLSIKNDGGSINISTDAICAFIEKIAAGMPAVVRMKAKVVPVSGGMDVSLELKMKAIPQMQDVCDTLQRTVRENLATGLGIRQIGSVEVMVRDIVEAG